MITRNPIHSVFMLLLFFHIAGCLYLMPSSWLQCSSLYGAILILYLFVVMLLNVDKEARRQSEPVLTWMTGSASH
jgi:NADH:ubiquinone oxidoreductase subunit 6 (subunit J)